MTDLAKIEKVEIEKWMELKDVSESDTFPRCIVETVALEMVWITMTDGTVYGRSIRTDETSEQLKAKFEETGKIDEHCATFFDD